MAAGIHNEEYFVQPWRLGVNPPSPFPVKIVWAGLDALLEA
jgi:hypothetical protein